MRTMEWAEKGTCNAKKSFSDLNNLEVVTAIRAKKRRTNPGNPIGFVLRFRYGCVYGPLLRSAVICPVHPSVTFCNR